MKEDKKQYYSPFKYAFTLPQVYGDALTNYENVCSLRNALYELVDQLNANWDDKSSEMFTEYLQKMFAANIRYTPDDLGLHLDFTNAIAEGDHIYNPKTETMEIVEKDGKEDGETFKIQN